MKKTGLLIKKLLFSFFVLFGLAWLFNSCRKDQKTGQSQPSAILAMQTQFAKLGYNDSLYTPLDDTSRIQWLPHWDVAVRVKADSINYAYVPLSAALQQIKTGKLYMHTINARLVRYVIVETFKGKNSYFLATYLNTDTANSSPKISFNSFTGVSCLQNFNGKQKFLVNYKSGKTFDARQPQRLGKSTDNLRAMSEIQECFNTFDCTYTASCFNSVGIIGVAETFGYGSCQTPLGVEIGCTIGTPTVWTVTQIKEGEVCIWVDSNDPNAPPPPLPPQTCPTCTPPPPTPPAPPPTTPPTLQDLLSKIKFAAALTTTEKINFSLILTNIDATATGHKALMALDAYYQANPNAVTLTVTDVIPKNSPHDFLPGSHTIELGDLLKGQTIDEENAYSTAHEIYHEFETVSSQSAYQSNFELDAYMFGAEVIKEMPDKGYNLAYEADLEAKTPTTTAQTDFNNAWANFLNGDTSASNYAILDNNFLTGSKYGPKYTIYTGQTVTNNPNSTPLFLK